MPAKRTHSRHCLAPWQFAIITAIFSAAAVRWFLFLTRAAWGEGTSPEGAAAGPSWDAPTPATGEQPRAAAALSVELPGAPPARQSCGGGKQFFFFPGMRNASWRAGWLDLGCTNFLLHSGQFHVDGYPGNTTTGVRAYLRYTLWRREEEADGAHRFGAAAALARSRGVGVYKFPPRLLGSLPARPPQLRYGSCAVVGNGGILLHGMLGPEIDSHDMVVRMNGAPTHGFEANVGNKTTFGFINHAHFKRLASMEPPKAQRAADGKGRLVLFESNNYQAYFRLYSSLAERFPPDELRMVILSPDFTSASYELWQRLTEEVTKKDNSFYRHKKPTTGWFAAAFAAEICDQVDLYGFEAYKRRPMQRVKYHYFDKVQGFTNVHSFELTVKVFQHLGSVGFPIRIVAPGNASSP